MSSHIAYAFLVIDTIQSLIVNSLQTLQNIVLEALDKTFFHNGAARSDLYGEGTNTFGMCIKYSLSVSYQLSH